MAEGQKIKWLWEEPSHQPSIAPSCGPGFRRLNHPSNDRPPRPWHDHRFRPVKRAKFSSQIESRRAQTPKKRGDAHRLRARQTRAGHKVRNLVRRFHKVGCEGGRCRCSGGFERASYRSPGAAGPVGISKSGDVIDLAREGACRAPRLRARSSRGELKRKVAEGIAGQWRAARRGRMRSVDLPRSGAREN